MTSPGRGRRPRSARTVGATTANRHVVSLSAGFAAATARSDLPTSGSLRLCDCPTATGSLPVDRRGSSNSRLPALSRSRSGSKRSLQLRPSNPTARLRTSLVSTSPKDCSQSRTCPATSAKERSAPAASRSAAADSLSTARTSLLRSFNRPILPFPRLSPTPSARTPPASQSVRNRRSPPRQPRPPCSIPKPPLHKTDRPASSTLATRRRSTLSCFATATDR